ncbi:MAG: hypothetical protein Q7W05_05175 [Deltaproteobacteria bacterium]|nr:hypothetical protein [Deltaproteobacteria bacterium]
MSSVAKAQKASKDPSNDKFKRINEIPDEKRKLFLDLLRKGHSPQSVAEEMQILGFNKDMQLVSLRHLIEKYRKQHIPVTELISPYMVAKETSRLKKGVNFINGIIDLIDLQTERIRSMRIEEIENNTHNSKLGDEIVKQGKLHTQYVDMSVKAGLYQTFIKEIIDEINEKDERPYGNKLAYAALQNPDIRAMVHHSLNNMLIELDAEDELAANSKGSDC